MKKRFILFMSALIFYNLAAQNPVIYECHQQIETKSKALKSRYVYCSSNDIYTVETSNDPYIPSSNSPIYTVRLNLHVMQEDDGVIVILT